jgi:23S rRNA (adenine2503-C2)-methyltransferase
MGVLDKMKPGKSYATIESLASAEKRKRYSVHRCATTRPCQPGTRCARVGARSERAQRFHARQIFRWIYKHGVTNVDAMTDLSRDLRATLARDFTLTTPALAQREKSVDGTEKFLLRLADGTHIESVFIPDTPAMTFCVSTQVGCAMACAFCLTGKMGLVRNLTAGEIAGQVRVLANALELRDKKFNIVLMGMGEPLHNYDEDDARAAHSSPTSTGSTCRRGESRCRRSACCPRWQSSPKKK